MIESPYLPVELIFNLLCVYRKNFPESSQILRRAMYKRGLFFGSFEELPRLSFWIRLCQSASLLDKGKPPRPTMFAEDWLDLPLSEQLTILVEAWLEAPEQDRNRRIRHRFIEQLLAGEEIRPSYRSRLIGLQALGICEEVHLTPVGSKILSGRVLENIRENTGNWRIMDEELHIPYPPDWRLLWHLEHYLIPTTLGVYLLSKENLRQAAQCSLLNEYLPLKQILKQGLGKSPPPAVRESLDEQPVLKVLPGPVLEFSSHEDLKNFRQTTSMRKDLRHILSPHHVCLDFWQAPRILRRLKNSGLLNEKQIRQFLEVAYPTPVEEPDLHFSIADRTYLLTLVLILSKLDVPLSTPMDLMKKLTLSLNNNLRTSAVRKAYEVIEHLTPQPDWVPEEEPPDLPEADMIDFLESAIQKEEPIDVLYHVPSRPRPEHRHLTPLLLEQRGPRFYLIAYCHHRRANRTFRLDRMQLLKAPPLPGEANLPSKIL